MMTEGNNSIGREAEDGATPRVELGPADDGSGVGWGRRLGPRSDAGEAFGSIGGSEAGPGEGRREGVGVDFGPRVACAAPTCSSSRGGASASHPPRGVAASALRALGRLLSFARSS
jgi:hypothetical protein